MPQLGSKYWRQAALTVGPIVAISSVVQQGPTGRPSSMFANARFFNLRVLKARSDATRHGCGGAGRMAVVCAQVFSVALLALTPCGCTRTQYRHEADTESYCLINSRKVDPRWDVPGRRVEPLSNSRMYVGAEQDCGPKPQDDLAAKRFMDCPDGKDNTKYYREISTRATTENPAWLDYLPREEDGKINLTQPLAIDLALLHSRDYQTQFESVYLTALGLSGNRFEFDTQWFGGLGGGFTATGSDLGDARRLDITANRLGFGRSLAGGGQFATSLLNSLSWDFGSGVNSGSAALVSTFTQPLLRGAFRHVRLENLTQAERNLLYSVRDFARFRRLFYVDVTASYLNLLTNAQAISNTRTNVENLRQNLIEHQLYAELETVSQVAVDQVFQQYQNGRLSLLSAEQNLITLQDAFKFQLGLPAWVPLEIDDSQLQAFELVEPNLVQLQDETQALFLSLVQYDADQRAPKQDLVDSFEAFQTLRDRAYESLPQVHAELEEWLERLNSIEMTTLSSDDKLDIQQQKDLAQRLETRLAELKEVLEGRATMNAQVQDALDAYTADLPPPPPKLSAQQRLEQLLASGRPLKDITDEDLLPKEGDDPAALALKKMQEAVGEWLRGEIGELYVAQNQIRVFLIDIEPRPIKQVTAITYAYENRLDLMNSKATVMDAFRKVEVAADALESDLSVNGAVALGSDPTKNNAFRFDSSANSYRVGVEFDGPLNRLNERNVYRASQIVYQQASRQFMADKDRVANDVRSVLRQLELRRLNFQIARQQVVTATRQVEQAQIDLRNSQNAEANLTLFLLDALQAMLDAKNNLISNWIQYRIQKMRLFAALEMLYLDENGNWINEDTGLDELANFTVIDPEYFPPQWSDAYESEEAATEQDLDLSGEGEQEPGALELVPPGQSAPNGAPSSELPVPDPSTAGQLGATLPSSSQIDVIEGELSFRPGAVSSTVPYSFDYAE